MDLLRAINRAVIAVSGQGLLKLLQSLIIDDWPVNSVKLRPPSGYLWHFGLFLVGRKDGGVAHFEGANQRLK